MCIHLKFVRCFSRSINARFGSGVVTSGGIILNNHLADFDIETENNSESVNQVLHPNTVYVGP